MRGVLAKAQRSEPTAQFAVLIRGRQWPCLRRQPAVKLSVQSLAVAGYINPFSPTRRGTKLLLGAQTILAAIVRGGRRGLVRWSGWPADPSDPPQSPPIQAYSMLQTVKGGVRVAGLNPTDFPQWFVSSIRSLHLLVHRLIWRSVEPHPGMRTGGLSDILPLIYHQRRRRSKEIHCLDRCREVFCIQIILCEVLKYCI